MNKLEKHVGILGFAVATVVFTLFAKRAIKKSMKYESLGSEEMPSPKGEYFYLGHLPLLGKRVGTTITNWHKELGSIFRLKIGAQNWVVIGDPLVAHEILVTKGIATCGRPELTFFTTINSPDNRGVLFADYSKKWKQSRNAILSILSPKSVDSLSHILERESQKAVNIMKKQASENQDIDPQAFTSLAGMNLVLAIAFGIPGADSLDEPAFKKIRHFTYQCMKFTSPSEDYSAIFPILKFLDPIFRKEKRMVDFRDKEFHPFMRKIIKLARESNEDSLVKKLDEVKEEYQIDEQNIVSLLSEILVVGTDTTSVSTSWAIAILCRHPKIQKKISDEIDMFLKKYDRQPSFADRDQLPYFVAFVKECFRFRTPIDLSSPHKAIEDVAYKNYIIPKGHFIFVNIHTLHNDPDRFSEPEKFMPERFLNDTRSMHASSNGSIQTREHYGFGWGRRICPGIYLTECQIFHVLTKILATCTIEPTISPEGNKVYPDLEEVVDTGFVIGPTPFKIRLAERENKIVT
ncbi:hypothetical protein G6F56_006794 [Rhizopus delemar]|uniref:Cytochrome P450-dit2 n=1 Tax=Rhizopus stolonifer TaxID=4846 RepID=A0A367KLC8_RHIST|nr:hypothetical protein G6F56_006794 [Rhizopus delemar]RCI02958.1 hypothetical protein CU098_005716 [Rhizopus stolonifer]